MYGFPAGVTSDGILMAALTGGARTKFAKHGEESEISSSRSAHITRKVRIC